MLSLSEPAGEFYALSISFLSYSSARQVERMMIDFAPKTSSYDYFRSAINWKEDRSWNYSSYSSARHSAGRAVAHPESFIRRSFVTTNYYPF